MKTITAIASAACFVTATATIAAASTRTSTDVQSLATAEAHVVTVLQGYRDTAAWKAQFKAAIATQAMDLAKVNGDLVAPAAPGALRQIAKTPAIGQGASASVSVGGLSGPQGLNNPTRIVFVVTSTPPQAGILTWDVLCNESNNATAETNSQIYPLFPVVYDLHMPVANPTSCIVSASAGLKASGSVTIRLDEASTA